MLGAIIGDIAGSYYEVLEINEYIIKNKRSYEDRIKILDKNTPLFTENSSLTDDSILTYSIYKCIKDNSYNYEKYLKEYALKELELGKDMYGRSRFSPGFIKWVKGEKQGKSFGNGSAMRISPVGYLFDTLEEVKEHAYLATIPSHNDKDALKAAEAVAVSIYLLRNGITIKELKKYIEDNYYKLDFNLEELRHNYEFSSFASTSVPEALFVLSESTDFESTIRNAISIGGDCDTIACIAASLAEAAYGIPEKLKEQVKPYLRDYMTDILEENKVYKKEF